MHELPRLLITLGDVAGIGPEVLLKLWSKSELFSYVQPVVVGDIAWLHNMSARFGFHGIIQPVTELTIWPQADHHTIPCVQGTSIPLAGLSQGQPHAAAGQAAFDFLKWAINATRSHQAEAIVTLPLHKEGLHRAQLNYPGHTEILAEACNAKKYAMMLYAPEISSTGSRGGIGVAHVTLHQSMRSIFQDITINNVLDKIQLTHEFMAQMLGKQPRVGVCALNPHASDGGLFGHEEAEIISPAVKRAVDQNINVTGPWPSDTLFRRAQSGDFDGIVAMYHDQGHIALKLMSGFQLVNVTLGLTIIRTSVAHGTGYDIVEKNCADPNSLLAAITVACKLICAKRAKLTDTLRPDIPTGNFQ